ncbi:MAG: 16S rRNA (cytosine(1402)-N(4))-methyltransferase RsmH [Desulfobacteraceae bacterium]|jgi:16S rRNA (cytosine1402-N4)-methyltransferase
MIYRHVSAMLQEAVACLACRPGGIYVDGTLGGAGHARAICQQIMPDGLLIGIDQDADAIANARHVLEPYADNTRLFHGNFIDLPDYLDRLDVDTVDGILLDLGLSQHQLEGSGRGFSFRKDEPLDMRMDIRHKTCAADLVNQLEEAELTRIFKRYGEERWSRRISRAIVAERFRSPIQTSRQLADVVVSAVPRRAAAMQKIHPATRVFQALRIAVNQELDRLAEFLDSAVDLLSKGGRLCILSFHSLEDRMVKHKFKVLSKGCDCPPDFPVCVCKKQPIVRVLTKKVRRPTQAEIARNPLARSTRLRAVEKI